MIRTCCPGYTVGIVGLIGVMVVMGLGAAAKAALVEIRKLGKREARQRLVVLDGSNVSRKAPARGHRNGQKRTRRTSDNP